MKKEKELKEKLRIKVKAYDVRLIDSSVKQIIEAIKLKGGEIIGPIPLPTEVKRYTVNRSPFIYKKSREQFELKVHKRLIEILNPEKKIVESLSDLNLPAGVDVEIKIY